MAINKEFSSIAQDDKPTIWSVTLKHDRQKPVQAAIHIAEALADAVVQGRIELLEGADEIILFRASPENLGAIKDTLRGSAYIMQAYDFLFGDQGDLVYRAYAPSAEEDLSELAVQPYTHGMKFIDLGMTVQPLPAELGLPEGAQVPAGRAVAWKPEAWAPGKVDATVARAINGLFAALQGNRGRIVTGDDRSVDNGFIIVRTDEAGAQAVKRQMEHIALVMERTLPDQSESKKFNARYDELLDALPETCGWEAVNWLQRNKPGMFWHDLALTVINDQYAQRMHFVNTYMQDGENRLRARLCHDDGLALRRLLWADDYQQQVMDFARKRSPQPPAFYAGPSAQW